MSLLESPIGCVPIVWNNADWLDLAPETPAETVLDEIARLGFAGTQHGRGFPEGDELRAALARRGLRFAELYSALAGDRRTASRPGRRRHRRRDLGAAHRGRRRRARRRCSTSAGARRDGPGASRTERPRWPDAAFDALAELLEELAAAGARAASRVAFHPHAGTYVETPAEVERSPSARSGTGVGLCLDVGHYLVGGGDPVDAIARSARASPTSTLKDVDPAVLAGCGRASSPGSARRSAQRIFTELGNGALDLDGVLAALDRTRLRAAG